MRPTGVVCAMELYELPKAIPMATREEGSPSALIVKTVVYRVVCNHCMGMWKSTGNCGRGMRNIFFWLETFRGTLIQIPWAQSGLS
jgi:hypothetical protein